MFVNVYIYICIKSPAQVCCVSSYSCQALLVYYFIANESLGEAAVSARLSSREGAMAAAGLRIEHASEDVRLIGEESLRVYL